MRQVLRDSAEKIARIVERNDTAAIVVFLALFFVISLRYLELPGLNADEAAVGIGAGYFFHAFEPLKTYHGFRLFGTYFPLMYGSYTGAVLSYPLVPFFYLFGIRLFPLRLMSLLIALTALFFIYKVCRMWFGKPTAWVAVILSASHPAFFLYGKMAGTINEIYMICLFWGSVFFVCRFLEDRKLSYLCLGMFFAGIGLNKIASLWYVAGVSVALALFRKREGPGISLTPREKLYALLSLCLGSGPIIVYNILSKGATVRLMYESLAAPTTSSVNNFEYAHNLYLRLEQFATILLKGVDLGLGTSGMPDRYCPVFLFAFAGSIIAVAVFAVVRRQESSSLRKALFLLVVMAVITLCSPFSVSGLWAQHIFNLFPIPQIIVAFTLCVVLKEVFGRRVHGAIVSFLCAAIVASQAYASMYYTRQLERTGGQGICSTRINELAAYLDSRYAKSTIVVNGSSHSLRFLTGGRVNTVVGRKRFSHEDFMRYLDSTVESGEPFIFVMLVSPGTEREDYYYREFMQLKVLVRSRKKNMELKRTFYNTIGEPVYRVYEINGRDELPAARIGDSA